MMPNDLMNLVNLAFKFGDWVNTITNFHIVMTLAVIGWLFSAKTVWSKGQRAIVMIAYAGFAAYNIVAQYETHQMLQATLNELHAAVAHSQSVLYSDDFKALLGQRNGPSIPLIVGGYAVGDLLMLALIWFSNKWKTKEL